MSKKSEWWDVSWNPVEGCKRGCTYCWAKKFFRRFHKTAKFEDVRFHPERLNRPLLWKRPKRIFVGSMCDLFADWTPRAWVDRILEVVRKCPQHTFMFLTKSPAGYRHFKYPKNVWLGASVSSHKDWFTAVELIRLKRNNLKFLSVEPVLGWIDTGYFFLANWIIVGGLTPKPVHKKEWIDKFLEYNYSLKKPIFLKDNLHYQKVIKEFPKLNTSSNHSRKDSETVGLTSLSQHTWLAKSHCGGCKTLTGGFAS